ncbi:hypothetical protein, partial [Hugenholtzia roseola]|uniref:hypothetical protein n=1 Tax=Hugenholtzia roseola TaxID=1002 RepID=UPI00047956EA
HQNDILEPTILQRQNFKVEKVADLFPKYYILKINNFNDIAKNTLDEWIYFLKNSEVKDTFKAKGLDKAKEKLRYESLTDEEKKMYNRSVENRRIEMSVAYTKELELKHKEWEAKQEEKTEIARNLILAGSADDFISKITGLTIKQVEQLRNETKKN